MRVVRNNEISGFVGFELIERLRNADSNAMDEIYHDHKKSAFNYMRKIYTDEQILEDVYQDAIAAVYKNVIVPSFVLSSDFQGYINRVCRNQLIIRINNEKKQEKIKDGSFVLKIRKTDPDVTQDDNEVGGNQRPNINRGLPREEMVDTNIENISLFNRVWNQMKSMSEQCFEILNRSFLMEKKDEVVAEELGYANARTLINLKSRCLKKLKIQALKLQIHS